MKKVLLSGLALFAGLTAIAQPCSEGFFPTEKYAGDNFSRKTQWNNVYWWTQAKPVTNVMVDSVSSFDLVNCVSDSQSFAYSWTRDNVNKKLSYVITQRYGKYEPVGVGWGTTKEGRQAVLDLSGGNEKVTFTFTNTSTIYDVELRVALQDSNKNEVNAIGDADDDKVYEDEVKFNVNAGQTITKTVSYTPAAPNLPYKSLYTYDPLACNAGTAAGKDTKFDPTIVAAVMFTVINQENSAALDGYKPYTISNFTFDLSNFHVGAPAVICTGLENNNIAGNAFKVMPNPASSYVEFPESQNVKVMDAMGKMVYTANTASRIDVSNLTKGVYMIQTSNGTSRFVVE